VEAALAAGIFNREEVAIEGGCEEAYDGERYRNAISAVS
jgi:hypothetical protein